MTSTTLTTTTRLTTLALVAVLGVTPAGVVNADVVSDGPAAILIWPDVMSFRDSQGLVTETLFQIANTSQQPVLVHCFHENANYHCSNTGAVCTTAVQCCDEGAGCGVCEPGWLETDFRIKLTPRQPLGWLASEGMARDEVPLDGGAGGTGIGGASNAGTHIPPVAENPYNGLLKCIAINDDGTPSDRNVLKGEATRYELVLDNDGGYTVAKHNAVGIRAIEGAVNDDNQLVLGGGDAEYEGCPEHLIINHLFDGVWDPIVAQQAEGLQEATASGFLSLGPSGPQVFTRLTLVPCTQDLLRQIPGSAVAQYLVYNEFEQRFSTSRSVECKFESLLSLIDTTDMERSIFSAGVAGTVVGQTRVRAVGSGLIGVAAEGHAYWFADSMAIGNSDGRFGDFGRPLVSYGLLGSLDQSDFNIHQQGDRAESDIITLP